MKIKMKKALPNIKDVAFLFLFTSCKINAA